jgi:hypothetical protein
MLKLFDSISGQEITEFTIRPIYMQSLRADRDVDLYGDVPAMNGCTGHYAVMSVFRMDWDRQMYVLADELYRRISD